MRKYVSLMNARGLKKVLNSGGTIQIRAMEDVDSSKPNWVGCWEIYAFDTKNEEFRLVVTETLEPKIIKTAISVMQHCKKFGFDGAKIPFYKGQITEYTLADVSKKGKVTKK